MIRIVLLASMVLVSTTACAARSTGRSAATLLDPASAAMNQAAPESYTVLFETSRGDFTLEATRAWAPRGADRFYNLVRHGFYDGAHIFRVVRGFVAQFGIPADPGLTAIWKSQRIPDDPVTQSNRRGTVSFATAGPNTRTFQVFINLADNERLDPQGFAPFGRIVAGMEVVDSLYAGYGDGAGFSPGPDQARIEQEGAAYVEREFPRLDRIVRASIVDD